jgi:hypothetical protein
MTIQEIIIFVFLLPTVTDARRREKGNAPNNKRHISTIVRCFLLLHISYVEIIYFFPFCKDVSYQFIKPWY